MRFESMLYPVLFSERRPALRSFALYLYIDLHPMLTEAVFANETFAGKARQNGLIPSVVREVSHFLRAVHAILHTHWGGGKSADHSEQTAQSAALDEKSSCLVNECE